MIIEKLTFDVVIGFVRAYWKPILLVAAVIALIWVYNWRIKVAYDAGYAAKAAEIDAAMVQVGQTIARLNGELAAKDAETVRKIEEDREKRPFRTQYVRERLVNAPEFAAIERPRDLASCRLWQLCQIDSAATGGVQREWCNAVRGSCDGVVQPSR